VKKNAVMTVRVQDWVKEFYEDKENIRPAEALEFFALLENPTDFLKCRLNHLEHLKDEAEIELAKINSEYDFLDKKLSLINNTNNFFDKVSTNQYIIGLKNNIYNTFGEEEDEKQENVRTISGKTRLDVFERDDYRCQMCGRTVDDGIKLHIDHIVPFSKGGSSDMDNLQVLCHECNLAKHDRMDLKRTRELLDDSDGE
jgi:predicted restriction endonuclease